MSEGDKRNNDYVKYSSLGVQMVVTILLFVFLGRYLDQRSENAKPIWTAILSILGVVLAMLAMLRVVMKPPKKPKKEDPKEKP